MLCSQKGLSGYKTIASNSIERKRSPTLKAHFCGTHHSTVFGYSVNGPNAVKWKVTASVEKAEFPALFQPPGKEGFLFGPGSNDSWDNGGVGTAVVRRYLSDNEERWTMWYQGWKKSDDSKQDIANGLLGVPPSRTGLAVSSNGIHWSRGESIVETNALGVGGEGMVMEPSENWWTFDTHHLSISDCLIMSSQKVRASGGVYWMYYSGGDKEDVNVPEEMTRLGKKVNSLPLSQQELIIEGLRMRPGLAMSNDGRNWARIEGEHHSWALFDVGEEGDFDSLFIGAPQVIFHGVGDIRMYYHSFSLKTRKFTVGFARSKDGLKWTKFGKCTFSGGSSHSFDEMGIASRNVIKDPKNEGFLMLYEGISKDGIKSLGLARSKDGLWDWEKVGTGPIFSPSEDPNAWDCGSVGSPNLVDLGGGNWRLYYVGVDSKGVQGIGMAQSFNSDFTSFQRWQNPSSISSKE